MNINWTLLEPDINPTYQDLTQHYRTAVIPARSRHSKDKAKAESAVLVTERWILAALRNHTFFSLAELNHCIAEKLTDLNTRKFQKLDPTRKDLFETIDKPTIIPLPSTPYEHAEWKKAQANIDYHVEVDRHHYSVPCQLVREQVDVRLTATTVEIPFKNKRVSCHQRSSRQSKFTTLPQHMPKSHQRYLEWTPSMTSHNMPYVGLHKRHGYSLTPNPPDFFFQLKKIASAMPILYTDQQYLTVEYVREAL